MSPAVTPPAPPPDSSYCPPSPPWAKNLCPPHKANFFPPGMDLNPCPCVVGTPQWLHSSSRPSRAGERGEPRSIPGGGRSVVLFLSSVFLANWGVGLAVSLSLSFGKCGVGGHWQCKSSGCLTTPVILFLGGGNLNWSLPEEGGTSLSCKEQSGDGGEKQKCFPPWRHLADQRGSSAQTRLRLGTCRRSLVPTGVTRPSNAARQSIQI